jgi:tRNA (guanine-N7-)-methyltransferase
VNAKIGGMNPKNTPESVPRPRAIRSYVLRSGRTTAGQARALATLGPRYLLPYQPMPLDLDAVFGRQAPRILAKSIRPVWAHC